MKKTAILILLCLSLAAFALAESGTVDVDFTELESGAVTDTLYDLLDAPEENQGKTARIAGYAHYVGRLQGEEPTFYLTVGEGAGCCAELVAFIPMSLPESLDDLALSTKTVTVTGKLDFYDAGGYDDVRLIDALVTWPEV